MCVTASPDRQPPKNIASIREICGGPRVRRSVWTRSRELRYPRKLHAQHAELERQDWLVPLPITLRAMGNETTHRSDAESGLRDYLAYTMFGAPTGGYQLGQLANLSTNHWSIDAGGGYTYFDTKRADARRRRRGYFFQQLTGDSGAGATLGAFKSRIAGVGPEIGYFFPVGKEKGYVNLKSYWEFAAQNRAEGWNLWLSLALPLSMGK